MKASKKKDRMLAKTTLKCFKNGLDHTSNFPRTAHTQRSPSEERRESFPHHLDIN